MQIVPGMIVFDLGATWSRATLPLIAAQPGWGHSILKRDFDSVSVEQHKYVRLLDVARLDAAMIVCQRDGILTVLLRSMQVWEIKIVDMQDISDRFVYVSLGEL